VIKLFQQGSFIVHIPFTGIEMGTEDEVYIDVSFRNPTNTEMEVSSIWSATPKPKTGMSNSLALSGAVLELTGSTWTQEAEVKITRTKKST